MSSAIVVVYLSRKYLCAGWSGAVASAASVVNSSTMPGLSALRRTSLTTASSSAVPDARSAASAESSISSRCSRTAASSTSLVGKWWIRPGCEIPTRDAISRSDADLYPTSPNKTIAASTICTRVARPLAYPRSRRGCAGSVTV